MSCQLTSRPRSRGNTADYPKDGTYESQLEWVTNRGYPEDGTHEAKLEWVRAKGQLPPYPRQGTPLEKNAWARLSTAYFTHTSDTKWHGEDLSEPLLVFTVSRRRGEIVSLRFVPRQQPRAPRPRTVRRARAQARAPGSKGSKDPPEPEPPLEVVPLSRFRRDVRRWLEGAA